MFDEIIKRWINTGQLTQNDIIPLFLEWDKEFGEGKATPEEVVALINSVSINYMPILYKILKYVSIQRKYEWAEIYDQNGTFKARYWNKIPD